MKKYVKQSTNTVHLIGDIRREYPNISIPSDADCSSFGYEFLIEQVAPSQDGYVAIEKAPINNVQQWELQPKPVSVPRVLAPRQVRLQLLNLGLLDEVEALCSADRAMSIWFEYSLDFQRNHEMIEAMGTQLGMSETDMDNFFIEASKL